MSQKNLIAIIIIAIVLLVGWGAGHYLLSRQWRRGEDTKTSQPGKQIPSLPGSPIRQDDSKPSKLSGKNKFKLADVKIGDTIGEMRVVSIEAAFDKAPVSSYNVLIKFKGRVTVSGVYDYDPESLGGLTTFTVDSSSAKKIPILTDGINDYIGAPEFSFTNRDFEWRALNLRDQSKGGKGTATIIIDNFSIRRDEGEGGPTAELISVIKKRPTTPLTPLSPNEFTVLDISDGSIKVGDTVAGMKIISIAPFTSGSKIADRNLMMLFNGKATIAGKYRYRFSTPPFYGASNKICFIPDGADNIKIPRLLYQTTYFCFSNQDSAKEIFGPEGSEGKATIEVDNYKIQRTNQEYPNDVPNRAELVRVIKN